MGSLASEAVGEEENGSEAMEDEEDEAPGEGAMTVDEVNLNEEKEEQGEDDGEGEGDDGEDEVEDDKGRCCRIDDRLERDFGVIIFKTLPILPIFVLLCWQDCLRLV